MLRVLLILCYVPLYLGFWFHRSSSPWLLGYSARHWLVLLLLAAPFPVLAFAPRPGRTARRRVGLAAGTIAVVLLVAHLVHDSTREHRFDPFLQTPRTTLEAQYPEEKGARVFRVLALGGSTTRGQRLAPAERYPARLEAGLRERFPGRRIEVLNVGQNWWTTKHSLVNYVTYAARWRPDLVVVMHGINDLEKSFAVDGLSIGEYQEDWGHHYAAAADAALAPALEEKLWRRWGRPLADTWFSRLRIREVDFPLAKYRSIEGFTRHLRALVHYARADGARVMLVTQPALYSASMAPALDAATRRRRVFRERRGLLAVTFPSAGSLARAMDAVEASVRDVAATEGALFVDAASEVPQDLAHHRDDVHLTPRGADALARAIVAECVRSRVVTEQK